MKSRWRWGARGERSISPRLSERSERNSRIWIVWLLAGLGLSACTRGEPAVSAIAIHPTNPQIVYVGTSQHVYKSRDGGRTWALSDQGMSSARVMSLAVDPRSPALVYAGTFGDAIWKSWDGGQHWVPDNRGLKEHLSIVTGIVFDRQISSIMYIGSTVGIYKRTDPEAAWLEKVHGMESVYVVALAADPKRPEILYAGTSGGVYKSVNRAERWEPINRGLDIEEVGGALSHGVNAIAIHPEEPATLYIGTTRGLFISTDGGRSWIQIRAVPAGDVSSVVIDSRDPSTVYAGGAGVFKTTDGGVTWQAASGGLTSNVRVLAMDPQNPRIIYAGTHSGLFKTADGGQTWEQQTLTSREGMAS
ncbi:MAG: hypothetical protein AB1515_00505 [Nitrospirota bacterium]